MWINRAGSAEKAWRRRENAHKLSTILCKRNKRFHDTVSLCAQEAALGFSAGSISRSSALYSLHCRRKMGCAPIGSACRRKRSFRVGMAKPPLCAACPVRCQADGLKTRPAGGSDGMKTSPEPSFLLAGGRQPDFSGVFIWMRPEAPSFLCYALQKGGRAYFFGDPCQKRRKTAPQCW